MAILKLNDVAHSSAETVLNALVSSRPISLAALPNSHGIYGLLDHIGEIRYIGVTASPAVGFHNRIYSRHVAGSEGRSHKFSHAYNCGRMWQARKEFPGQSDADAAFAKRLRVQFTRRNCKAVYAEIARESFHDDYFRGLTAVEAIVQAKAPLSMRLWEGRNFHAMEEPSDLVDELIDELKLTLEMRAALLRQAALYEQWKASQAEAPGLSSGAGGKARENKGSLYLSKSQVIDRVMLNPRPGQEFVQDLIALPVANFAHGEETSLEEADWFVMRPQKAQAYGRPSRDGFLVREGSTAMANGSPLKKRDRDERDRLVRQGVLIYHSDSELLVFSRDHVFNSSSLAGGVVKDGNCSGPSSWKHVGSGRTLAEMTS